MVELHQVVSIIGEPLHQREYIGMATVSEDVQQLQVALLLDEAQHAPDRVGLDVASRQGYDLVQHGEGVAHAAVRFSGDHAKCIFGPSRPFLRKHGGQPRNDVRNTDASKVEALATRKNRRCRLLDLLRLGGREDEDHPRWWLLEDLQQGVPRLTRKHVSLVDDVDLVPVTGGCIHRALAEIPGIIDTPVGGSIDLDNIQGGVATPNAGTALANAAGLTLCATLRTVQRHREHTRECGLADTARPAEEVRVTNPPSRHRAAERVGDVLLRRHFRERARSVLTG